MGFMFTPGADLSGLFESPEQLYVTDIIHKTTIDLKEHSEEENSDSSFKKGTHLPTLRAAFQFFANHPFVYYIWDRESKTSIFSGRVTEVPLTQDLPIKICRLCH